MKNFLSRVALYSFLGLGMALSSEVVSDAQMTDSQVVEYVKKANKEGKSQQQIASELLAKGVTEEQVNRIRNQYSDGNAVANYEQDEGSSSINRDSRISENLIDEEENLNTSSEKEETYIFGHEIFQNRRINFEPNENAATPQDYKLGPNDEVIIDIWGYNEATIRKTITPEGKINIDQIGPVYLSGLTIEEASKKIKKVLSSKYSGIDGEQPNTEVSVSLGQIRTIQVSILGEVVTPGSFRLSPFSTVFTAVFRAGGVSDKGTLRAIKLVRGDKVVSQFDFYEYIFRGNTNADIRLEDGDLLIVPSYVNLVKVSGSVKRPMHYEMLEGESLAKLIEYAGGFASNAYTASINVVRKTALERSISSVSEENIGGFVLQNGDEVRIETNLDRFSNRIEIRGSVFQPDVYELGSEVSTVRQLVEKAGGLKEDAFLNRAIIHREKDDLSFETVSVPLGDIMSGVRADIALKKNDLLIVSSKFEVEERGTLTINGSVSNPGTFPFAANTTIEDLILQAGGLVEGASMSKVDVSRRFVDSYGLQVPDELGETFTFSIKDGFVVDGGERFVLEPYDVVSVRKSPSYQVQQFVTIEGEVVFPGEYVLQSKSERLSSVIKRAGGLSKYAYIRGGLLTRKTSKEQLELNEATEKLSKMQKSGRDSLDTESLKFKPTYNIGIDMEKALANPGSIDDIILVEGDKITIPENSNVVSISGEVLYPNVVIYQPGKGLDYYISQAGGYTENSKKSKVYVVYMNGNVSKAAGAKFEPGCQVIVPKKPERKPMSTTEIMSIGTSTASLATMIVSLVNMLK